VARRIAHTLKATLSPAERARLGIKPTEDLEAYDAYLKGIHYYNQFSTDASLKSIRSFEEAIARDPSFALAHLGLARMYLTLGIGTGPVPTAEAFRAALHSAQRALELDPTLTYAYGVLGAVHTWWDWDWAAAARAFERANAASAESEKPHLEYGFYLAVRGRHAEALRTARRALALDPVSLIVNTHVALQYYWAHRFDKATEQLHRTLELDARFPPALLVQGWIRTLEGDPEGAVPAFEQALRHAGPITPIVAGLGCAQAAAGRTAAAEAILRQLQEPPAGQSVSPRDVALVLAWLGRADDAFAWLERGVVEHASWMTFLQVDAVWDRLRGDQRFAAIVKSIGLS
jgi:tetratricopeptide (TPR) repeat protein